MHKLFGICNYIVWISNTHQTSDSHFPKIVNVQMLNWLGIWTDDFSLLIPKQFGIRTSVRFPNKKSQNRVWSKSINQSGLVLFGLNDQKMSENQLVQSRHWEFGHSL